MFARVLVAGALLGGGLTAAAGTPATAASGCAVLQPGASAVAQRAVAAACGQIGVWYSWGGGHGAAPGATYGHYDGHDPASKDDGRRKGFDCSGLMRWAYYRATGRDILNGVANDQFHTSHAVARFTRAQGTGPLLPGDLMFWGSGHIHHVAMYLGRGRMVEAYESGTRVRTAPVRLGGDYAGALRVDGRGGGAPAPGGARYWVRTFAAAPGYAGPDTAERRGVLNKGRNYVYCRVWGARVGGPSEFNHWWMRTDLDRAEPGKSGRGAYVPAYYLARWGNDEAKDENGRDIPAC